MFRSVDHGKQAAGSARLCNPGLLNPNLAKRPDENGRRIKLRRPLPLLPDTHAIGGREVEFVAGLDVERFVPGIDVAQRREGADHSG